MESFKSEFVWPQELAYSAEPISTPNQFKIKSIRKQKPRAKPYEIEYDSTQTPHLWEFLVRLLEEQLYKEQANPAACYDAIIQWTDRNDYTFKLIDANQVASLWGQIKKRPTMNYDKMSRSLRYYYKEGVMQKIDKMRYTYKFLNTEEVNCFIVSYQRSLYPVNEHQTRKASKKSIGKVKCMESKSQQELEQLPLLSVNTNTPNSSFASTKTPKLVSNCTSKFTSTPQFPSSTAYYNGSPILGDKDYTGYMKQEFDQENLSPAMSSNYSSSEYNYSYNSSGYESASSSSLGTSSSTSTDYTHHNYYSNYPTESYNYYNAYNAYYTNYNHQSTYYN